MTNAMASGLRTAAMSTFIVLLAVAGLAWTTQGFRSFTYQSALRTSVQDAPRSVPAVRLQTDDGQSVSLTGFRGQWVLVDFIYTHCVTICTAQGAVFAQLAQQLHAPIARGQVRLLSISFDPARDDPAALARYRGQFGAGLGAGAWVATRPVDEQGLGALRTAFGLKVIPDGLGGFEHNSAINVVDPAGRLIAVRDWDDVQGTAQYVLDRLAS